MTATEPAYQEIRKHPRVNKKIKGDYRLILPNESQTRVSIETETVSGGGLMFLSSHPIEEGAHLEFRLALGAFRIEFSARVVWSKRHPAPDPLKPLYATGLQFTVITQEDIARILGA